MRFCAQELGKTVRLKDGDVGKVSDFLCEGGDFFIKEIQVRSGVWPFNKDYTLPPYLANFLKSDSDHLFCDLTQGEFKTGYQQHAERSQVRADSVALEQQWGVPYSWDRQGATPRDPSEEGSILSTQEVFEDPTHEDMIPLLSCAGIYKSEVVIGDDPVGQVGDIIFEPALMQARYLVVDDIQSSSRSSALLVPLEWVSDWSLDERQLWLSGLTKIDLFSAPTFERDDVINKEYEDQLCLHYGRSLSWRERPRLHRSIRSTTLQP